MFARLLAVGCQPSASVFPGFDPFDFVFMIRIMKVVRNHRLLLFLQNMFKEHGRTVVQTSLLKTAIFTCNPENVKCVLGTKFDDWAVQELRQKGVKWLLGSGIFTTDGAFWAHSRAMLRPAFEKSQLADLSHFENHIGPLLENILKDGSTVDLQELFHRFTTDTSSELLIGDSTKSLSVKGGGEAQRFADDFDYGMADAVLRTRLGRLYYMMPHPKAQKAINFCKNLAQGYVEHALKAKTEVSVKEKNR